METEAETTGRRLAARKKTIRIAAGLFVAMLIVFTLIGNTLQALTLPKVAAEQPSKGRLPRSYEGSAALSPATTADLTNPAGWKTAQVLVKPGDAVRRGQALVVYDDTEAQRQIEDETSALEQLKLPKAQLEHDYVEAVQSGDEGAVLAARTALESAKANIRTQQRRIERLRHDAAANRQLAAPFDGVVTEVHAVVGMAAAVGGPDVRLAAADAGFEFRLRIPAAIAAALKPGGAMDVRIDGDGGRMLKGTISKMEDETGAAAEWSASPAGDGPGGQSFGGDSSPAEPVGTSSEGADGTNGPDADAAEEQGADVDAAEGQSADATKKPGPDAAGGGEPTNSDSLSSTGTLLVTVIVRDPALRGGEKVEVKLSREAGEDSLLVSSQAIHRDRSGVYLYAIEKRQSPLGNAYYASRRSVTVMDENDGVAAVGGDVYDYDQIVLNSSEPLHDGERVRL